MSSIGQSLSQSIASSQLKLDNLEDLIDNLKNGDASRAGDSRENIAAIKQDLISQRDSIKQEMINTQQKLVDARSAEEDKPVEGSFAEFLKNNKEQVAKKLGITRKGPEDYKSEKQERREERRAERQERKEARKQEKVQKKLDKLAEKARKRGGKHSLIKPVRVEERGKNERIREMIDDILSGTPDNNGEDDQGLQFLSM